MSNYWRVLSPLHATVTGREKKAEGGRIGLQRGGRGSRLAGEGATGASFSPSQMASRHARGRFSDVGGGEPLPWKKYLRRKKGGRIAAKDGKWIQKATASIKKRGSKGKCTPITKKGCTGRAKALAKTFKKMAAKRKA